MPQWGRNLEAGACSNAQEDIRLLMSLLISNKVSLKVSTFKRVLIYLVKNTRDTLDQIRNNRFLHVQLIQNQVVECSNKENGFPCHKLENVLVHLIWAVRRPWDLAGTSRESSDMEAPVWVTPAFPYNASDAWCISYLPYFRLPIAKFGRSIR
jgi:hypothetical protein